MTQSEEVQEYDAVIVGAGQAGPSLAQDLAAAGQRVAVVERAHVGGTCVNEGCTPTKTMVASARVAYLARRAGTYGVEVGPVSVDLRKVRERKRSVVKTFREGGEQRLERSENITLLMGEASFTGPHSLRVKLNDGGSVTLSAPRIFLNTGARPSLPDVPGLRELEPLNSTTIMELEHVPEHLLIMGGSYIGVEFAQMFRRFGARVSVVERAPKLLSREDEDVSDGVAEILTEDGIELCLGARVTRAGRDGDEVWLRAQVDGGERELRGTHLLVAVGRTPNVGALNLEAAGVQTDGGGHIRVNDKLETGVPGIWALGDVKGGPAFTHISYDDYRIVRDNLLRGGDRTTRDRPVPYTVFMDPQLGRVGLSEREAREAGRRVKVAKLPMGSVARAIETDETRGFMKALVDADTDQILGAAILGLEGGEVMTVLEVAMLGQLPYTALRDGVFAHPLLSESLNNLFMTLE